MHIASFAFNVVGITCLTICGSRVESEADGRGHLSLCQLARPMKTSHLIIAALCFMEKNTSIIDAKEEAVKGE